MLNDLMDMLGGGDDDDDERNDRCCNRERASAGGVRGLLGRLLQLGDDGDDRSECCRGARGRADDRAEARRDRDDADVFGD